MSQVSPFKKSTFFEKEKTSQKPYSLLWLVFFGIFGVLLVLFYFSYKTVIRFSHTQTDLLFHDLAGEVSQEIDNVFFDYENILNSARSLVYSSDFIEKEEWETYISELNINERFPGISAIGYSEKVTSRTFDDHIQKYSAEHDDPYFLRNLENIPYNSIPAEKNLFPVVYIYPSDPSRADAVGLDLSSSPERLEPMLEAVQSNKATLSDQTIFFNEKKGFLYFLPIYDDYKNNNSEFLKNLENTAGFVVTSIRTEDFFNNVFQDFKSKDVRIFVYSGKQKDPEKLLYDSFVANNQENKSLAFNLTEEKVLTIGQNNWYLVVQSNSQVFESGFLKQLPVITLVVGSSVTILICGLMLSILFSRSRAISLAKKITNDLQEREELLRLFVEHTPAAVAMFDTEMRYIFVTQRWLKDYDIENQNIIGKSHYEVFPEISQEWKEIHQRCLLGAVEKREEDKFVRSDKSVEWLKWEIHPWRKLSGEIGGIIMFTESITERKSIEEKFRQRSLELEETNKVMVGRELKMKELKESLEAMQKNDNTSDSKKIVKKNLLANEGSNIE